MRWRRWGEAGPASGVGEVASEGRSRFVDEVASEGK